MFIYDILSYLFFFFVFRGNGYRCAGLPGQNRSAGRRNSQPGATGSGGGWRGQLSVRWPVFDSVNVCVVAVEPVAANWKVKVVEDKAITGLTPGCTWRTRRLSWSAMYKLPAESNAMPAAAAIDAAVAGPPSPE